MITGENPSVDKLMEFMYYDLIGLVQTDLQGNITLINPVAVQLLMPLEKKGHLLSNLFATLDQIAPDLQFQAENFTLAAGSIIRNQNLVITSGIRGQTEPVYYALSLVKMGENSLMASIRDVSEVIKRERLLHKQEAWINAALTGVKDFASAVLDSDGVVRGWNASVQRLTGHGPEKIIGQPYAVFFAPDAMTADRTTDRLREVDRAGLSFAEGWMQRADGSRFWGHSVITPVEESLTSASYSLIIRDITDTRETMESLLKAATSDQLTGVANRRALYEAAELEFARYARKPRNISLLILDIDHFKKINDTYGHPVGDKVIRNLAMVMLKSVRSIDVVARFGGEEFAVLLPSTDIDMAHVIGERIRRNVEAELINIGEYQLSYRVSVGVAGVELGISGIEAMIEAADDAMYEAKHQGRNRVYVKRPAAEQPSQH